MGLALALDRSDPARPYRDLLLNLGVWERDEHVVHLSFAMSGGLAVAYKVATGEIDLAVLNPSACLTMAYRGTGPFDKPLPLRAIAVIPSWDRMAFAISERTGIGSVAGILERKYPLKVSVRADPANPTRLLVDEVLGASGFSLDDVKAWGGIVHEVNSPTHPARLQDIETGDIDAVFDEGINGWGRTALINGMRFLSLDRAARERMESLGWPTGPISSAMLPGVPESVMTASFCGWPLFTHADLADDVAYRLCAALEAALPHVDWGRDAPGGMRDFCTNSDLAPLGVPLHDGAARFYRERGYL
jgi:TRAP-type uncharacterized transport system substrate-binding protein